MTDATIAGLLFEIAELKRANGNLSATVLDLTMLLRYQEIIKRRTMT